MNYPDQSIEKVYRNNYAVFGKTHLKQKYFPYTTSLTGSARWDYTTDFKDYTSWKIEPEVSYENYFKIFLGGNVANGYTLPSYYSLFWKGDAHVSGNPDLKPESSLSWQIFSKLELLDNSFKVTYRHDDIDDMIIWIRDEWKKWKPEKKSYFNEIIKGEAIIGSKKRVYHVEPGIGYTLNRPEFICQLARKAEKLGTIIQTDDKIKTINDRDGKFIVDASGCPSTVKRELEINRGIKGVTYQQDKKNRQINHF